MGFGQGRSGAHWPKNFSLLEFSISLVELGQRMVRRGLETYEKPQRSLDDMEVVLARAEESSGDKDSFSRCDGEFHLLIARASANPLLLSVYRQINQVRLHAQWNAMKENILTPDVITDYNRQHRGIYNALHERDAQAAQALITEHLEKARDDLLRANSP